VEVIVENTELLPFAPLEAETAAPPAPTVTVYAVPKVAVKADSIEPPPPDVLGLGVGAEEV